MAVLLMVGLSRVTGSLAQNVQISLQMNLNGMFGGKGHRFSFSPPLAVLRGTAICGTWIVSLCLGYFPCTGLASITHGSCLFTGSARQEVTALTPSPKEAF